MALDFGQSTTLENMSQLNLLLQSEGGLEDGSRHYPLAQLPCIIGRGSNCGLQLDFKHISREHAKLELRGRQLVIVDLNSTNGTFVNDERITEPTALRPGDRVHFADHPFTLLRQPAAGNDTAKTRSAKTHNQETVAGFTAPASGFPVQAPEFFELLNDELLIATSQAIHFGSNAEYAYTLRARSTHPKLKADSVRLFKLAEDLGEEVRLAGMIRRIAVGQADRAGLHSGLFLQTHAVEFEDPDLLIGQWAELVERVRHLELICEVPLSELAAEQIGTVQDALSRHNIKTCGLAGALEAGPLAELTGPLDYLRINAKRGIDDIAKLEQAIGQSLNLIVEHVDDAQTLDALRDIGIGLLQGRALSAAADLPVSD